MPRRQFLKFAILEFTIFCAVLAAFYLLWDEQDKLKARIEALESPKTFLLPEPEGNYPVTESSPE